MPCRKGYLRPTNCYLGEMECLDRLIEGPCRVTMCPPRRKQGPLRPKLGLARPVKGLLVASQGLHKQNSDLQFTQVCEGHSSGQFRATSGRHEVPQSSAELCHSDRLPSWAERGTLRPKEGPLIAAQGPFRPI